MSFPFPLIQHDITSHIPRKYARTEFWQDMRKIMKSSTCKFDQICWPMYLVSCRKGSPSFANSQFHLRIASSKKALKEAGSRHLLVIPHQALHQFDLDSVAFLILVAIIFLGKCLMFCEYLPDPMHNLVAAPRLPIYGFIAMKIIMKRFDVLPRHHLIPTWTNGAPDLAWMAWMKIPEVAGLDGFLFLGNILQMLHWGMWERRANDTALASVLWPLQRAHFRVDKLLGHPMC